MRNIAPPNKCRATVAHVLSLTLVYLPLLALSGTVAAQSKPRVLKQRTLPISSGTAVLQTTAPPLHYLPSLDEIKQKSNDPELKKLIKPNPDKPEPNKFCRTRGS